MKQEESDFFDIDIHQLDREWVRQPRLYHDHAIQLADAREVWERAKAEVEIMKDELKKVYAEVDLEVRSNPAKFGLEKVTEPSIVNAVMLNKRYCTQQDICRKSQSDAITAKHNADILEATVDAMEHRKKALENIVTLHGRDYFSTPKDKTMNEKEAHAAFNRKGKK